MIRIAILEHEKETKEIVFLLARVFRQNDWVFRHYFKASELARKMKEESYQIFIFDESSVLPGWSPCLCMTIRTQYSFTCARTLS